MNGTEGAKLPSHRRVLLIFGMFLGVFRVYWILKIINISSGIFTEFFSINVGKYLTYIRTPLPREGNPCGVGALMQEFYLSNQRTIVLH